MSELIRLFRDHVQGRVNMQEITVGRKLYYAFGEVAYDAKTPTSLKTFEGGYYTLESIISLWKHRDIAHTNYVREVSQHSIIAVTFIQRKPLLDYLNGRTDELQGHDQSVPVATPIMLSELVERLEKERGEPKSKRARLDNAEAATNGDATNEAMEVDGLLQSDETRGLASKFSAEQIAQMRSKVKNNLKTQPKQPLFMTNDAITDPLATFPFSEVSDSCVKAFQECELPSSSRAQLYSCAGNFDSINGYFVDIKNKQNGTQTNGRQATQPARPNRQTAGYSRYDQEVFHSETDVGFQIETNLSFHGTSFNDIGGGKAGNTFNTQPNNNNNSNDARRRISNNQPISLPSRNSQNRPGFGPPSAVHPHGKPPKKESKTPIIIIPASGTALITMYNAVDLLQHLRYVPTDQRKKEIRRESDLIIQRTKENGSTVPYRVIDDPRKLRDEEWDRIVAVFVQGPSWQFKGWKYNQQPTEIFSRICAFHIKFDEQPLDKNVAGWSVKVLSLSQQKRHLDRAVMRVFWDRLDSYMVKNKPNLRF